MTPNDDTFTADPKGVPGISRTVVWAALLVAAAGTAILPFGSLPIPANPSFMPAFGAIIWVVDLITGMLLLSQARNSRDQASRMLGTAYLFSALIIPPQLAAFPDVFMPGSLIGSSGSAVWLWCVWHAGFALCVLRFALASRPNRERKTGRPNDTWRASLATAVAAVLFTVITTAGLPYLPTILVGTGYARLNSLGIGPFVVLCNLAALAAILPGFRTRPRLEQWVAVALTASTFDTLLTLTGGGRYTLGWYAARCLSLTTGLFVLIALLSELCALFARTAESNRVLQQLSRTDSLTGLPNRRAFDLAIDAEWRRARRESTSVALLILDIDRFKSFNDRYGHPIGDACLRLVAQAIAANCRRGCDLAARFGGEEFAVLLPDTDAAGAECIGELIRTTVSELSLRLGGTDFGRATISVGCAARCPKPNEESFRDLIEAADTALYQAKRGGRNRVVTERDPAPLLGPIRMEAGLDHGRVVAAPHD